MGEPALADRECVPCTDDEEPLRGEELAALYDLLDGETWELVDDHHLRGTFGFEEFRDAFEFTKEVGELAEEVWHHPEIHLKWGQVVVEQWTYVIDGLFETDFVVAARIERVYERYRAGP